MSTQSDIAMLIHKAREHIDEAWRIAQTYSLLDDDLEEAADALYNLERDWQHAANVVAEASGESGD